MERCDWADLPEAVHREVERRCGPIGAIDPVAAGMNNALTCVVHTGEGACFLKGAPTSSPTAWMFRNEIAAAAAGAPGPSLVWSADVDGWMLLCWQYVRGRHPDLAPGSGDLASIAAALWELAALPPLAVTSSFAPQTRRWEQMQPWRHLVADPPEHVDPWVKSNVDNFAAAEYDALQVLTGTHLAHTDLHERNLLIDDRQATLIDWAWARPGAPWLDTELLTVRLVAAGHTCEQADRWRRQHLPLPDLALDLRRAFAIEMLGVWLYLSRRRPQHRLFADMASVALRWAQYLDDR